MNHYTKQPSKYVPLALFLIFIFAVTTTVYFYSQKQKPKINKALLEYEQKLSDLKEQAEKNPNDYVAHSEYAYALYVTSNNDQAIEEYSKVVALNASDARAYNNMGNIYRKKKQYPEAITAFNSSISADPSQINAYINLAHMYIYDLKQLEQGYKVFDQVIAVHPENIDLRIMLAKTLQQNGQIEEATASFSGILEVDPNNSVAKSALDQLSQN